MGDMRELAEEREAMERMHAKYDRIANNRKKAEVNAPDKHTIRDRIGQFHIHRLAHRALVREGCLPDAATAELVERVTERLNEWLPGVVAHHARLAAQEIEREQDDRDIVQVQFPDQKVVPGFPTWTYRCPGAEVHDLVIVPPTPYCSVEQYVPVVAKGRAGYTGPVKTARLSNPRRRVAFAQDPDSYSDDF